MNPRPDSLRVRAAVALRVLGPAFLLAGCAGLGANFNSMTADQIAAATKDKSASASCIQFTGTGGQFMALHMNNDKGSIASGSASLKCGAAEATFTDQGKPTSGGK